MFLTASPQERARRRGAELGADPEACWPSMTLRDQRDESREHRPLRAAADAVTLDTTGLTHRRRPRGKSASGALGRG